MTAHSDEQIGAYMKKKLLALTLTCTIVASLLTGCGDSSSADDPYSGTITVATWDNNLYNFIDQYSIIEKFQEKYPNVDIEIEKVKSDSEYWDAMKMRASANQLPDVMFNKTFTLSRFKDYLVDLTDTEANKNNELAAGYALDGKVLGIPTTATYEYVYYWKDMFEEAGVEVPTTWDEFVQAGVTLQNYYGAQDPEFLGLACGLKDEWPDYPFMEFMPSLESGNGQNWNDMAKQNAPFSEGTDINKAYQKANQLFTSGCLGKDPLGLGHDQVLSMFSARKAAMIACGDWALQTIQKDAEDVSNLGTFYLPVRDSASDPYNVIVQGDSFMGVTKHSKHPEAAQAFVEYFFSEECYPDFIHYISSASAMANFPKDKDPALAEADTNCPDMQLVMYDGGGDDFTAIQNEITFDYKKLGAQMLTDGFDLNATFDELNNKWKTAREKLGIQ